jgi:alpha-mannosidase
MNNHWGTNYRAYQEGPVVFRFVLRPHRGPCSDGEASRLAIGLSQPLVAVPGRGPAPRAMPLLRVEPADVIVGGLKPSDDGRAIIVRLLGAGDKTTSARLTWSRPAPKRLWLSDTSERPRQEVAGDVQVPAWGIVTLRAERPE